MQGRKTPEEASKGPAGAQKAQKAHEARKKARKRPQRPENARRGQDQGKARRAANNNAEGVETCRKRLEKAQKG